MSERTVRRKLKAPVLPDAPSRRATFGRGILEPYKQQLLAWWNEGIRQTAILMDLLKQAGYTGSDRTLMRYLRQVRAAQGLPPRRTPSTTALPKVTDPQSPPLTARRVSFLMVKPESNRDEEETDLLARLVAEHPDLQLTVELADEFLRLIRQRQAEDFDAWLMRALKSALKPFQAFAESLFEDYAAVRAGMKLEVSNGMVEGFNNRLKMVKRQMYGRAGLGLLSKRLIMA